MHRDNLWSDNWHGHRVRRGDMAPVILKLLMTKPMHGYEIISHLEEQTHGMWRPSAGSVYPNLQLLEEQELVKSSKENGKKIYSLTDKGEVEAKKAEDLLEHRWQERQDQARSFKELKLTFIESMGLLRQIAAQDSPDKNKKVKAILIETRDKLTKLASEG